MLALALLVGVLGGWGYDKWVGLRGSAGGGKHSARAAASDGEKPLPETADNPSVPDGASA